MADTTPHRASARVQVGLTEVGDRVGSLPRDNPQTRQHRIHQGKWRSDVARWPAGPPQNDRRVRERYATLPNWLAEKNEGRDVSETGPNLMSHEALDYTHGRLEMLARIDGKAEPDRLWRNLLSSQPLAFSIAGHLHRHPGEAALKLLRAFQTPSLLPVRADLLDRVLGLLTHEAAEVLRLRFVDGLDAASVAARLGIGRAAVNQRVARAKRLLRDASAGRPDLAEELREAHPRLY